MISVLKIQPNERALSEAVLGGSLEIAKLIIEDCGIWPETRSTANGVHSKNKELGTYVFNKFAEACEKFPNANPML
jgi:hypothetical protein